MAPKGKAKRAAEVARRSLEIASEICVYTNHQIMVEELGGAG